MARYNEILVGRLNRGLQRLLAIKGESPSPQVASEIMPVLPLALGVEYRHLDSWDRWGIASQVAPVAAQFGVTRLRNPSTSNAIIVVERVTLILTTTTGMGITQNKGLGDLAAVLQARNLDGRNPRFTSAAVISSGTVTPLSAGPFLLLTLLQGQNPYDFILNPNQELILTPGESIDVTNTTANIQANSALAWRERFLEDTERNA